MLAKDDETAAEIEEQWSCAQWICLSDIMTQAGFSEPCLDFAAY